MPVLTSGEAVAVHEMPLCSCMGMLVWSI